jgi:sigma-B regulation protein RsbU (phosphoserine phosphatase)
VGGDYYDFIPTRPELIGRRRERGRWALVMGDVMGKGVPAGLLMTMLRGMLRAKFLVDCHPIASFMTSTNSPKRTSRNPTDS